MTSVSIAGVAIGVAALIIVLSVMGGFEQDLRQKMLTGQPHLEVLAKENPVLGFSLKDYDKSKLERDLGATLEHVQPFVKADVVLKQRKHLGSATLIGIGSATEPGGWAFEGNMIEGNLESLIPVSKDAERAYPGIVLGENLAMNLSVQMGDVLEIISPDLRMGDVLSGDEMTRRYQVVGIFQSNMFDYDLKWAVVYLDEARKFMPEYSEELHEREYVTGLAVNVEDPFSVDGIKAKLASSGSVSITTWQDVNSSLLFALKLEKFTMGSILMLIVVVAAFSISGTMMMTVFHRRHYISLLRALGMPNMGVGKLFLIHGCLIGVVGIGIGVLLGVLVCAFIYYFSIIPLPEGVYYLQSLPVKWLPNVYVVICIGAFLLSIFAALYPALTASKQDPSGGLRYR